MDMFQKDEEARKSALGWLGGLVLVILFLAVVCK